MLTDLVIQDYQSIKEARLRLGLLTVITGPTGSGKSAVIRALRTVAFNSRGNAFVRHGAKKSVILAGSQDEGWAAAIERGQTTRTDQYRVVVPDPDGGSDPVTWTYTKLGGDAPEEVRQLHQLTALNFAAQTDLPFLLDESGSQVARMLGELTNVSMVYSAAREAARRKGVLAADLKRTDALVIQLTEQAAQYAGLPVQRVALVLAEQHLAAASQLQQRAARLTQLQLSYDLSQQTVAAAQRQLSLLSPPSLGRVEELAARRTRLRELLSALNDAENDIDVSGDYAGQLTEQETFAHRAVHDALIEAGTCPMCGQAVTEFTGLATMFRSGNRKGGPSA